MTSARPLISVLVPVYNVERFVAESLASIAAQTYREIEIVVVDDCSTDGTFDVVKQFAATDSRVVALRNERNLRIAETLNRALAASRGEFIARSDGDDLMMPDRLEMQHAFLQAHPGVDLVGCDFVSIDENGGELRVMRYPNGSELVRRVLPFAPTSAHIWLARRALYDELRAYRLSTVEDYDFLLRADRAGHGLDNVPGYVGQKVRIRSGNTISRYGLTQRVLFNYARRLHRCGDRLRYSPEAEAALVASSRDSLMAKAHYVSDLLSQRGAKSRHPLQRLALYAFAALCSPYKMQHFYLRLRVMLLQSRMARPALRARPLPLH